MGIGDTDMRSRIVNILLTCLSAIFGCYIVVTLYSVYSAKEPTVPASLAPGKYLAGTVFGAPWPTEENTVVLFLSTNCHYCDVSMPFYKTLVKLAGSRVHFIAAFPQDTSEARAHLADYGVPISDVRKLDLKHIGVSGTPTLAVTERSSKVDFARIGSLSAANQRDLLIRLGIDDSTSSDDTQETSRHLELNTVDATSLIKLLGDSSTRVIDIRERTEFAEGHINHAISMPLDEIEARHEHEIPLDSRVIVYCKYCGTCERAVYARGEQAVCSLTVSILKTMGYRNLSVISDEISQLAHQGIPVSFGSPN